MQIGRKIDADLIVIGNGLVGLIATAIAAEAGRRVLHFRFSGGLPAPQHDWLHSGLLLDTDPVTARLLRLWGRNTMRKFGISQSIEKGVFVARSEHSAWWLRDYAANLGIPIRELDTRETRSLAGPQFSASHSFTIPDAALDLEAVGHIAQSCSAGRGAATIDVHRDESVSILPGDSAAGGFIVHTAREMGRAPNTLLVDGVTIPALIEPLGLRHSLALHRSLVISTSQPLGLSAGLLVDMDRGLSYLRQRSASSSTTYTIARTWNQPDGGDALQLAEFASSETRRTRTGQTRVAVAHEVQSATVDGKSGVLPWIHEFRREGFPGLVAAVCNVASLALWTARQVMKILDWLPNPLDRESCFERIDEARD